MTKEETALAQAKERLEQIEQYANNKMLEFLIEIKNECFDKPRDTFQEAYAYLCIKIIDKIVELNKENERLKYK